MPDGTMDTFQILWTGASEVIRLAMIVALVYVGREWIKSRRPWTDAERRDPADTNGHGREPFGERLARIETEVRGHTLLLSDMKSSITKLSSDIGGRVQGLTHTFEADLHNVEQRLTKIETKCNIRTQKNLPCDEDKQS